MKITEDGAALVLKPATARDYAVAKSLPGAVYDKGRARWTLPNSNEAQSALITAGVIKLGQLSPPPQPAEVRVGKVRNALFLESPPSMAKQARAMPDRRYWKPTHGERGAWVFSATARNVVHIVEHFPMATWSDDALAVKDQVMDQMSTHGLLAETKKAAEEGSLTVADFKFNQEFPPFAHQEHVFALSRDADEFALFMEMGTGKTRVVIDTMTWQAQRGRIDGVLVICPNSIKSTWSEEVPKMAPEWSTHDVRMWDSKMGKRKLADLEEWMRDNSGGTLKWFVTNVEGYSSKKLMEWATTFAALHNLAIVIDESSRVKNPKAKRTKAIVKLGRSAKVKRIMSGTPITQGPLDLFSQFKFLDPHILGYGSFYSFRNHFAIMGGFNNKEVVGYQNVDELLELTDPYTYRVTRAECTDLPPKVFSRLSVPLSPAQRRAYDTMKASMVADIGGTKVTATIVLTQMLRLQQIVGGFLPVTTYDSFTELEETHIEKLEGPNPKVDALLDLLSEANQGEHVIIWARFRSEIELIGQRLAEAYGRETVIEFHGGTSEADRTQGRLDFQDPDKPIRFFVGQTETGGLGITLTAATLVVYFSNSFSLESRLQSEDRAHRIGQKYTVNYVDITAEKTLDEKVLKALRAKKNLADMVTGDNVADWI